MCMLSTIIYIFGLVFLQATAATLVDAAQMNEKLDASLDDNLHKMFGSVGTSMLTLYYVALGYSDARKIGHSIWKGNGLVYLGLYFFFISFLTFAVFNIVIGLFVDTAMSYSEEDRDSVVLEDMSDGGYVDMVVNIMRSMDLDMSGAISYHEFEVSCTEWGVQQFLEGHDIKPQEAKTLFWRLSAEGTEAVSVEDFVHVFTRMKGWAKAVDIQALVFDQKRFSNSLQSFRDTCLRRLEAIEGRLAAQSLSNVCMRRLDAMDRKLTGGGRVTVAPAIVSLHGESPPVSPRSSHACAALLASNGGLRM